MCAYYTTLTVACAKIIKTNCTESYTKTFLFRAYNIILYIVFCLNTFLNYECINYYFQVIPCTYPYIQIDTCAYIIGYPQ